MSSAHQIKLLILGLLLFPAALFAQTSTTGRIDEGPLAARPTVCTPGDYYVTTDTNPVVEYKCSVGNVWNQESGGGGGGAPGGVNGDTQCKSGAIFVACSQNVNVLYASGSGSDANSGKTWDTAKLNIMAAVQALPGGGTGVAGQGTVYVGPGAGYNPAGTPYGIWLMGANDPNFATPPTGWLKCTGGGSGCNLYIVGVPNNGASPNGHKTRVLMTASGAQGADTNHPGIWLSNVAGVWISNLQLQYFGRAMVVGECSNNNRTGTCPTTNVTFDNVGGQLNQIAANGPCTDITGASFWIWLNDHTCGGNAINATGGRTANAAAAILIDGTSNTGVGLIHIRDTELATGGIKVIPGSSGAGLYADNIIEEGDFTHPMPPVVWFTSFPVQTDCKLSNIQLADAGASPPAVIENDGAQPGCTVQNTLGEQGQGILGPAVILNQDIHGLANETSSPRAQNQVGFFGAYAVGETDVARRIGGLTPNRFTNVGASNTSNWQISNFSGTNTLTPNILDPFGGTGAATASSTAATSEILYLAPGGSACATAYTPTAGDWLVAGVWERTSPAVQNSISISECSFPTPTFSASYTNGNIILGDGQWTYVWVAAKVSGGSATHLGIVSNFSSAGALTAYGPVFYIIPAGTISDNEVLELVASMNSVDSSCAVGSICDVSGHPLSVNALNIRTGGTANAVTDWATSTSLGSIIGNITGQNLTSSTGVAPLFVSPGIQDGNGGLSITTTPYTIQCDSATALIDRAHILRFQFGASAVTVPLSTATGCTGGFVVSVIDESVVNLTFSATSGDTFSIYDGGTVTTGATSFILAVGQYATLNQGAAGIWEVRKTSGGVGATAAPVMAWYLGPQCSPANTGQCFYTPANTQVANDCTWSNSSTTVTCATSHFVPADVGKRAMGFFKTDSFGTTFGCVAGRISFSSMTTGVLTVATYTSATQIALSANPANAATSNHGCFIWGTPDDLNATNFETAYAAVSAYCPKVMLAAAGYWFSSPHFFSQPVGCANLPSLVGSSTTYGAMVYTAGFELEGRGPGNTVIYLGPDFPNGDTCAHTTGGVSACFVVPVEGKWTDLQITGGAQLACQVPANKVLLGIGVGTLNNVTLTNMCNTFTGGQVGIKADLLAQLYQVNNSGWGVICFQNTATTGGDIWAYKLACENSPGTDAQAAGGSLDILGTGGFFPTVTCNGCILSGAISGNTNGNAVVRVASGSELHLVNTAISNCEAAAGCSSGAGTTLVLNKGGRIFLNEVQEVAQGGTISVAGMGCTTAGGAAYVEKSSFTQAGGNQNYFDNTGCTLIDLGGNNSFFVGLSGTAANFIGSYVGDGHTSMFTCTGTANASVTNSLYGTGPNITATTCAGQTSTLGAGIPFQQTRTLQGINCTSSATTVSVACTVLINGSATSTPTCTMTAATHCIDFSHFLVVNPGDLLSAKIVTGAAETGANIKMQVIWQ